MFDLNEWERNRLSQVASSNALTYMGHHLTGGLRPHEVEEMERWKALSDKLSGSKSVTVADINAAFDPADEAFGGAFKAGFREGWLFAKSPDFEDREEAEEDYPREVDMAPTECWDAYREIYFAMLPLAAIPKLTVEADISTIDSKDNADG